MPMTKVDNEHDQLISMVNQLMDERERLSRENEYLKAKLNESVLIETIHEMKKERDLLFKLLSNLTINYKDEQLRVIKQQNNQDLIYNGKQNSTISRQNPNRIHRLKTTFEQQATPTHVKRSQSNKKIFVYTPQTQEINKIIRKPDIQLKHSQNSPFQHYRSQSLQDLT